MMSQKQILVVEDNSIVGKDIQKRLCNLGYNVPQVVSSGEKAINAALETKPDLVLMDIMLKGAMDGLEAAEVIAAKIDVPIVFLTAYADDRTLQRAKATGPFGYLLKPFNEIELHTTIEIALYKHQIERKLRESEEWLSTTLHSIGDAVIATDMNGVVLLLNESAENLTGWKSSEAKGKDLPEVFKTIGDSPLVSRSGAQIPIETTTSSIRNANGSVTGVVIVFRDITERLAVEKERQESDNEIRRLNEELQLKLNELTAVNIELAAFNYSVSHDLRTPLVNVDGFASVLLEQFSGRLDSQALGHITTIRNNARRMLQLIDDLLSFSRLSRSELERETISINALVHALVAETKAAQPDRNIIFKLGALPPTHGDKAMIRQVYLNLLSNALKFTDPRDLVVIEVGSILKDGKTAYFVKDNGVGFDMRDADRLFEVFQRLHSATQFEGSGVGLAIVQRIIERHGGHVWAEGRVNEGATFYFTLPDRN
jgi:signal transduction histidine kinase/AmiR/NasT family two-component response regulator